MNFYARTQSYRCIITEKTSQVNHFFHVFPGKNLSTGHLTESCLYFRRKLCYHTHRRRVSRETPTPPGDNHLLCKKFQSNSPGRSPIPARGRKTQKTHTGMVCVFCQCVKKVKIRNRRGRRPRRPGGKPLCFLMVFGEFATFAWGPSGTSAPTNRFIDSLKGRTIGCGPVVNP